MPKPKAVIQKITAWSFSRWSAHSGEAGCPYKAKLKFIERRQEPTGIAMTRGNLIHKMAENALLKPKSAVPVELKEVKTEINRMRKLKAEAELELCLTKDWVKTGWFDANAWCRIKIDAIASRDKNNFKLDVNDWKTGKYKPDNKEYAMQLELYGAGVMSAYPHVKEVTTSLVFTDHPQREAPPIKATFVREQLPELVSTWEKRVLPVLSDTRFSPRPGFYCRYCHFRKSNGGPCKY